MIRVFEAVEKFKSIRFKALLVVLALLVTITVAFYFIVLNIMSNYLMKEATLKAEALGKSIAEFAGYSIISNDLLGLDNIVFKVKERNSDIDYASVTSNDLKTLVHSDLRQTGGLFGEAEGKILMESPDGIIVKEVGGPAGALEIMSPVIFANKRLGAVYLGVNRSMLIAARREVRKKIIDVLMIVLVMGVAGTIIVSHFLTRPIQELSSGVNALSEGREMKALKVYSGDELGKLTASFNQMAGLITEQKAALEDSYISTIKVVAAALDARDSYTLGHAERVSMIAVAMAKMMGFKKEEKEDLRIACLLHDVGKIRIRDSILLKKGRFTDEERMEMKKHAEYGAEILRTATCLEKHIPAVRHHHEWFDGNGYPDGLKGDNIPIFAMMIAIADAFDGMSSDRVYRNALSQKEVFQQIREYSGTQFNPDLVDLLIWMATEQNILDIISRNKAHYGLPA